MLAIHTLQTADKKDRERLLGILKMHTRDRKLIDDAILIMTKYKARKYSEALQEKIVKEAWSRIDKKLLKSEAKERIRQLAEFLIERNK